MGKTINVLEGQLGLSLFSHQMYSVFHGNIREWVENSSTALLARDRFTVWKS